jgi:D-glycero-D-manno-heptose 1,7-bisphosphate phosphatase
MTVGLVLLDRDGTINRRAPEGEYVTDPEALELLPGAAGAIRALNDAGIPVAVVTNQRCVALGRLDEPGLAAVHARLRQRLDAAAGAHVDAIYHCPHERGTCGCRKPEPGLLAAAARDFAAAPAATVMIGDADSDVEAGRRFGARTIQLTRGPSASDAAVPDLAAAVRLVVAR